MFADQLYDLKTSACRGVQVPTDRSSSIIMIGDNHNITQGNLCVEPQNFTMLDIMVLKASPRRLVVQALKNPRRPPTPCQKRSKLRGRVREEGEEEEGKDFDDLRGKGNKREGVAAYLSMVRKVGEGAPTSFGGARAWRRRAGSVVVLRGAGGCVSRSSKGGPAAASGGGATAGRRREGRGRAERAEGELRGPAAASG